MTASKRAYQNFVPDHWADIEQKFTASELNTVEEDGSFAGYASLFGKVDLGKDRVAAGAFSSSINNRGISGVRMLFQHDPAMPIGVWSEITEDEKGLFVRGKITDGTAKGREILSLLRAGAIDGLSIGFKTRRSHADKQSGIRTILEADLWEISIVTFPMLPEARISSVKSLNSNSQLPSVRQFERWLTRDAGLSRSQARIVVGKGFAELVGRRDAAEPEEWALAETIRRATISVKTGIQT